MSDTRVRLHPTLGILVCTDGHVMVPAVHNRKAHWTCGSNSGRGYRQVYIARNHYLVHRLVAETFLGEIPKGHEVDHIDRNRSNNALDNLRIVTSHENRVNTNAHDLVDARGWSHTYQDAKQYSTCYNKTHKNVWFADGKKHWLPNEQAIPLLAIPVSQRTYTKR